MADPLLNEILRRAVFAQAVQGLPTGFAPQPITFAPVAAPAGAPGMAGGMAGGMGGGMSDVEVGPGMDAMGGGGGVGFGPIEGMQTFSTPFGPMTIADVIGKGVDLLAPMPLQLGSMMLTGKTMGSQLKGALTPVSTATPISSQAFGLAEQIGVTPAEAQGMINAMGGTGAVAGQDLGAMAAQSLGFGTGMGSGMGDVGVTGAEGGIGGSADSGAATGGGVM